MSQSDVLFSRAQQSIPGGVNSPVRAFKGVGGTPIFFKRGEGAYLIDHDNKRYIDYVGSWGPMILGHAYPTVVSAVQQSLNSGLSFGAPTQIEIDMAESICEAFPSIDQVRMVSSGTEATMSAIRLARGHTKRDKIVKFEGCYHGHSDSLLVKAGSGALTFGVPSSPGVPAALAEQTITLTFNDIDDAQNTFDQIGDEIACVIVEPVAGNMNCIPPIPGFLATLRQLCQQHGSLLIFDEVMSGFRVALGGAQQLYDVEPDLTTLGKVIGGGLPVGAFGGKYEVMADISPSGPVYQAGTLSGNPIALAAGLATLKEISKAGFYEQLTKKTSQLVAGLKERAMHANIPLTTNHVGSMFGFFFSEEEKITRYQQVTECDIKRFQAFYRGMLAEGIYFAPSAFEAGFMSQAHTDTDIQQTLDAAEKVFSNIAS